MSIEPPRSVTGRGSGLIGAADVTTAKVFLAVDPATNSIDWSTNDATCFPAPVEVGYSTNFGNDPLSRTYSIGAVFDQSDYKDPVLDQRGGAQIFSGLDPLTRFGRSAVYPRFDQMVWSRIRTASGACRCSAS